MNAQLTLDKDMTLNAAELVNNLAEKLGVAATEIYGVVESQAKVEIIKCAFSAVLCLAGLYFCWLYVRKVFIQKDHDGFSAVERMEEDADFSFVCIVILSFGVAVLAVTMGCVIVEDLKTAIQCALNPKFWALQELFRMVTGA